MNEHMNTERNSMDYIGDPATSPIFNRRSRRATASQGTPIQRISTGCIPTEDIIDNPIKNAGTASAIEIAGPIARSDRNAPTEFHRAAEIDHRIREGTDAGGITDEAK